MSTNPAPGEGRLSFDSPDVQEALARLQECDLNCLLTDIVKIERALTAEHDARVAAEKEREVAKHQSMRDAGAALSASKECDSLRADVAVANAKLAAAESENARIKNALKALVDQLDKVHLSDEYLSVWTIYMAHCGAYTGPRYINELTVAKAALAPAPTAEAARSDASTEGRTE